MFDTTDLVIDIVELTSNQYTSELTGQETLESKNDRASGALSVNINRNFPVSIDFVANNEQISFEGREAGKITDIKALVDLFGLSHNIQRWITDYLSGSRYHLKLLKGTLSWKDPIKILDTLEAEVRVDDTEYVFAPGFEPVKAEYTDVYFQKGVLIIKPSEATFYGQDCGESWVDIDFNAPENFLLTVYIKTRAVANDDILTLLNYYNIKLPFKQVEGKTTTDLRLAIHLNTEKVSAEGGFEIDEGTIEFAGENYKIDGGRITLGSSGVMVEHLSLGYELLVENDKLVNQVTVEGRRTGEGVFVTVNKYLEMEIIKNTLTIRSSDLGYNLPAIIRLLEVQSQSSSAKVKESNDDDSFTLSLKAENSQIYLGPQCRILADAIDLEFKDGKLSLKLIHGPGQIKLSLEDGIFELDGNDLNDEFMGALIQDSNFQGGRMSMVSGGSFDDFSIIFNIKDTTLSQQATLNNVMALINTVPALITFSRPEYNTEGLAIDSAIIGIKFKSEIATFESIELNTSVFKATGKGWIDFAKREIDMDFYLKTQASKNIGKVPLIGYALAGNADHQSTSLKIVGGVDDPEVSNSMVKDVVTYPIDVLFRILALPFRRMVEDEQPPEEKDDTSATTQNMNQVVEQ